MLSERVYSRVLRSERLELEYFAVFRQEIAPFSAKSWDEIFTSTFLDECLNQRI